MNLPMQRPAHAGPTRNELRVCDRHRVEYTSWQLPHLGDGPQAWSPCPKCEREQQRKDEWYASSGLEGRFRRATFDTFKAESKKQQAVLQACRQYVTGLQRNVWRPLWLIGPPGTGKTHLAAAIVYAAIYEEYLAAEMFTARQIIRFIRATWRKDSEDSEEEVIAALASRSLLVIDEIGVGFGSEAEAVQLLDVIDGRYQRERPTVLISNLPLPAVQASLGDRIFDRLRENAITLVCDWESHRQKAVQA